MADVDLTALQAFLAEQFAGVNRRLEHLEQLHARFDRMERHFTSMYGQLMIMRSDIDEAFSLRKRIEALEQRQ